jgi:arylsulfatase A-like enzyme
MPKSDLPFGSEFSPNQIDLNTLLEIIAQHPPDKDSLEYSFKEAFFKDNKTSERNKQKLAMNLRLSLKAYQIIDDEIQFTEFGKGLFNIRNDPDELYMQ